MTDFSKIKVLNGKLCKFDVVHQLVCGAISGDENGPFKFHDGQTSPTEEQIQAVQDDYDSKKYQRDRQTEYPSIQDVVVALAEKEEGDDTMWQEITALRQKVKSDNPKPT